MHSAANYWIMLCVDAAGAVLMLALGVRLFRGAALVAALAVTAGFLSWGGVEYAVHRWVLHGATSAVQRAHACHHREAEALISAPLFLSSTLAAGLWAALSVPLTAGTAALVVFGLYAGYNCYGLLHHIQHHLPSFVRMVPGLAHLERAHRLHHAQYVVNYGVTTTWWDRIFGSEDRQTRVSRM